MLQPLTFIARWIQLPSMSDRREPRLSFRGVWKTFDGTVALSDVSFDVEPAEIHALLGANGAGKSTLIKVLAGLYSSDAGQVLVDGRPETDGISFIHQDLGLVESLSVAECIALVQGYPRRSGVIDWGAVARRGREALSVLGATIDVKSLVSDLSRADQSIVAIARALSADCRLLVLDEPTASLPQSDVERLFEVLTTLRARGVSVLYVTHRLDEVFQLADRFTLLRDGRVAAGGDVAGLTHDDLVQLITGGQPSAAVEQPDEDSGQDTVEGASKAADDAEQDPAVAANDYLVMDGVRISAHAAGEQVTVRRGEILGLVGLRGSGQESLGRAIAGVEPLQWDGLRLDGKTYVKPRAAARALRKVVGFASSLRESEGLAMTLTVRENLFLNPGAAGRRTLSLLPRRGERARAEQLGGEIRLRPNRPDSVVATFSGGNQQKVVLGRWLSTNIRVLVLEEPTMGIDVGARVEIYDLIRRTTASGRAVVVVSSDFEELVLLCHRVLVVDRGAISAQLTANDVTVENITKFSSGAVQESGSGHDA